MSWSLQINNTKKEEIEDALDGYFAEHPSAEDAIETRQFKTMKKAVMGLVKDLSDWHEESFDVTVAGHSDFNRDDQAVLSMSVQVTGRKHEEATGAVSEPEPEDEDGDEDDDVDLDDEV